MTGAPATARRARPPHVGWGRLMWGAALLAAGGVWLLDATGAVAVDYSRTIAAALIVVGVVVPFVPRDEQAGVIGLGVVLSAATLIVVLTGPAIDPGLLRQGVGDASVTLQSATQVEQRYEHGVGDFTVDLRQVELPVGTTATAVRLGIGQLRVHVPPDVTVRFDGNAGLGDVAVLSRTRSGVAPSLDGVDRGASAERVLDLDVAVGVGSIEVTR